MAAFAEVVRRAQQTRRDARGCSELLASRECARFYCQEVPIELGVAVAESLTMCVSRTCMQVWFRM